MNEPIHGLRLVQELGTSRSVLRRVLGVWLLPGGIPGELADELRRRWAEVDPEVIADAEAAERREAEQLEYERAQSDGDTRRYDLPEVVTAADAQERIGLSPATIRKWVQRGYLEPIGWRGRARTYRRADVIAAQDAAASRTKRAPGATPTPGLDPDQTCDADNAARIVRVSPSTIRVWVSRGRLRPVGRRGRAHLYRFSDVIAVARSPRH